MTVNLFGKDYEVKVMSSRYTNNNNYAVCLEELDGAPFATLTVNLPGPKLPDGYGYVDTNNCPWAEEFICKYDLGEPAGVAARSGYCIYPLYKFNTNRIKER
jgi:hypothetical protein